LTELFLNSTSLSLVAALMLASIAISVSVGASIILAGAGREIGKQCFSISLATAVVGGVIGCISGFSSSPVAEPLLAGLCGVAGSLSVYLFGKDELSKWLVGAATIAFSISLFFHLLIGLNLSAPQKVERFCLKNMADPEVTEEILLRIQWHCADVYTKS